MKHEAGSSILRRYENLSPQLNMQDRALTPQSSEVMRSLQFQKNENQSHAYTHNNLKSDNNDDQYYLNNKKSISPLNKMPNSTNKDSFTHLTAVNHSHDFNRESLKIKTEQDFVFNNSAQSQINSTNTPQNGLSNNSIGNLLKMKSPQSNQLETLLNSPSNLFQENIQQKNIQSSNEEHGSTSMNPSNSASYNVLNKILGNFSNTPTEPNSNNRLYQPSINSHVSQNLSNISGSNNLYSNENSTSSKDFQNNINNSINSQSHMGSNLNIYNNSIGVLNNGANSTKNNLNSSSSNFFVPEGDSKPQSQYLANRNNKIKSIASEDQFGNKRFSGNGTSLEGGGQQMNQSNESFYKNYQMSSAVQQHTQIDQSNQSPQSANRSIHDIHNSNGGYYYNPKLGGQTNISTQNNAITSTSLREDNIKNNSFNKNSLTNNIEEKGLRQSNSNNLINSTKLLNLQAQAKENNETLQNHLNKPNNTKHYSYLIQSSSYNESGSNSNSTGLSLVDTEVGNKNTMSYNLSPTSNGNRTNFSQGNRLQGSGGSSSSFEGGNFSKTQLNRINNNSLENRQNSSVEKQSNSSVQTPVSTNTQKTALNTQNFKYNQDFKIMQELRSFEVPNYDTAKYSVKRNGFVKSYAANTNQGLIRNYNEDRVSIILNIMRPNGHSEQKWPQCSFFAVYDGHGGTACADFLRDNLHQFIIKDPNFPWNPREALQNGFDQAENQFLQLAYNQYGIVEQSGSCAIVVLIVDDYCYIANVGDSRAILSKEGGYQVVELSRDHKPMDQLEEQRIIEAGGRIYQSKIPTSNIQGYEGEQIGYVCGPHRVFPGRLSVTRTIGDFEAKLSKYGGNPQVIIPTPDIKCVQITDDFNFILLASDGIFDQLSSQTVSQCVWQAAGMGTKSKNVHEFCGIATDIVLKYSLQQKSYDNVTVVMIGFDDLKRRIFPNQKQEVKPLMTQASANNSSSNTLNKIPTPQSSSSNNTPSITLFPSSQNNTQSNSNNTNNNAANNNNNSHNNTNGNNNIGGQNKYQIKTDINALMQSPSSIKSALFSKELNSNTEKNQSDSGIDSNLKSFHFLNSSNTMRNSNNKEFFDQQKSSFKSFIEERNFQNNNQKFLAQQLESEKKLVAQSFIQNNSNSITDDKEQLKIKKNELIYSMDQNNLYRQ